MFFILFLLGKCVSFPKNAACIALNFTVGFGVFKPFLSPDTVLGIDFYADKVSAEFFTCDGSCTRARKDVKHGITLI